MRFWLALPVFTLVFAAPVSLVVMLAWQVRRSPVSPFSDLSDVVAVVLLTVGSSAMAATLALDPGRKRRRHRAAGRLFKPGSRWRSRGPAR